MALRPPLCLVGFITLFDLSTAVVNATAIPFRNAVTVNCLYIQTKKTAAKCDRKNGKPFKCTSCSIAHNLVHIDLDIIVGCGMFTLKVIPVD
jgi:hypothetical protein